MMSGKQHIKDHISALAKQKVPFLFVINFDGDKAFVEPIETCAEKDVFFKVRHLKNFEGKPISNDPFTFNKFPISKERYQRGFDIVQQAIADGNTYLINLTYPTRIETSLSLKEIFYRSKAKYKLFFKNKFVVFSPETFVRIRDQKIYSYPMKGTIDATIPNAYHKLKESYKEIAEHHTIVDLIRNDLNRVSKQVGLEKFRTIEKIVTHDAELLTVSSRIAGQLSEGYEQQIGELLYKMLPAGSVTGAPKKKTVAVIKEAEQYERGFYTGVFGIFDGYNLQSAVMIRFIENIDGQLFFKSGGGITTFSDCAAEYKELIDKVYLPITNI
jgi:para-aminobenzoate synthetase component 1